MDATKLIARCVNSAAALRAQEGLVILTVTATGNFSQSVYGGNKSAVVRGPFRAGAPATYVQEFDGLDEDDEEDEEEDECDEEDEEEDEDEDEDEEEEEDDDDGEERIYVVSITPSNTLSLSYFDPSHGRYKPTPTSGNASTLELHPLSQLTSHSDPTSGRSYIYAQNATGQLIEIAKTSGSGELVQTRVFAEASMRAGSALAAECIFFAEAAAGEVLAELRVYYLAEDGRLCWVVVGTVCQEAKPSMRAEESYHSLDIILNPETTRMSANTESLTSAPRVRSVANGKYYESNAEGQMVALGTISADGEFTVSNGEQAADVDSTAQKLTNPSKGLDKLKKKLNQSSLAVKTVARRVAMRISV